MYQLIAALLGKALGNQDKNNQAVNNIPTANLGSGFQLAKPQAGASTNAGGVLGGASSLMGGNNPSSTSTPSGGVANSDDPYGIKNSGGGWLKMMGR